MQNNLQSAYYNYLEIEIFNSLLCPALGDILGGLDWTWGVCVTGQFVTMGMGMGSMFFWKRGLFYWFVLRMWKRMGNWMVPGIFQLAIPVLAGSFLDRNIHIALFFGSGLSWGHNE
jgi:hypothetical protein